MPYLGFFVQFYHPKGYIAILAIKLLMITAEKNRATIQITLSDIFEDFNDNRKDTLMKRVKIALEEYQIRMKNEIQSNNLINLQMLLRKQQTLKNMQEKLKTNTQQMQETNEKNHFLVNKNAELESKLNECNEKFLKIEEKSNNLTQTLKNLQEAFTLKDNELNQSNKSVSQFRVENQRLQMQKQKLQSILRKMNYQIYEKTEESQYLLKIKQQQMAETFNQSLTKIIVKHTRQKQKHQVEKKLKQVKIQKKHEKIQVNISSSPVPGSNTSRQPRRPTPRASVNRQIQTDPTQETKIVEIIQNSPKVQQRLEEIRLIFTPTPTKQLKEEKRSTPIPQKVEKVQPKIIKHYTPQMKQSFIQTVDVKFKPPTPIKQQKICQIEIQCKLNKNIHEDEIRILQKKNRKKQEQLQKRYEQMVNHYKNRSKQSDLRQIQLLKIQVHQLKNILQKRQKELQSQRNLFSKINYQLAENQNNYLLKRLNIKLQDSIPNKNTNTLKSTNVIYSSSPKRIHTELSQHYIDENQENDNDSQMRATFHFARLKKTKEDDDLITVFKSKNTLKYMQKRRLSLKSTGISMENTKDKGIRQYKKYSKVKQGPFFRDD